MIVSLKTALYQKLLNDARVKAYVQGRIYNRRLPQNPTYPAITINRISNVSEQSHSGISGLAHPRIQIDCFSDQDIDLEGGLVEAIRLCLSAFKGFVPIPQPSSPFWPIDQGERFWPANQVQLFWIFINAFPIQNSRYIDARDLYHDEVKTYQVAIDFEIWHAEAQA